MDQVQLPSPFVLLQQSIDALMKEPAGYGLAGLGAVLVMFPLAFVLIFGIYALVFVGALPGMVLEDEMITVLGMFGTMFVGVLGITLISVMVTGPLYASVMRAIDAAQRGEGKLDFSAPFSTFTKDFGTVVRLYAAIMIVTLTGAIFCYVPGLVAAFLLHWAIPLCVLKGERPLDAMRKSVAHVQQDVAWHLQVWLVSMGIFMILSQIPLVGPVFAIGFGYDFQLRAFRAAYKD